MTIVRAAGLSGGVLLMFHRMEDQWEGTDDCGLHLRLLIQPATRGTSTEQPAQRHPGDRTLGRVARDASLSGLHSGFRVAAAVAALGFLVAVGLIGGRPTLRASSDLCD
jgi:hypothetical protein